MGEDVQLPASQPEEPSDSAEVTPVQPEVKPTQPGLAPEAVAPTPPAAEQQPDYNQLLANVETATDPMSLMSAIAALEKTRQHDKTGVYSKGYEAALRLGDRDLALMYGNRVSAEKMAETVRLMHEAVGGMIDSASRHTVAAETMRASADLMHRTAHPGY